MTIENIKTALESFAPAENAESWDNVGVLIGSVAESKNKNVLLTIDLTPDVFEEAMEKEISFIVAYHPVLFNSIKKITDSLYLSLIYNNIAVYSPHTQLDNLMNTHMKTILGPNPGNFNEVLEKIKSLIGLKHVRVVNSTQNKVNYKNDDDIKIGAGAAFRSPDFKNCLLITGEMSHHDLLKCKRNNVDVILLEHSNSERFYLKELKRLLEEQEVLKEYKIFISERDKDPIEII